MRENKTLRGEKVSLEVCTKESWHEFYKSYESDPMMSTTSYIYDFERVEKSYSEKMNDNTRLYFTIFHEGAVVGQIYLKHMNRENKRTEFGIALTNDSVKGKGFGTEAIQLLANYAFFTLGFEYIFADSVLRNVRSQYVLEKVGFVHTREDSVFKYYKLSRFNSHAPEGYICPFCLVAEGIENENVLTKQSDIIYRDEYITAFICAGWWENNKGHVLIIPNRHFENLYELPSEYSAKIHDFEKRVAIAMKQEYKCDGISSRQHNEPAGNQDVWHYHLHVFPRYKNDNLYGMDRRATTVEERAVYAEMLRNYLLCDAETK